jgi:hypothetical protein
VLNDDYVPNNENDDEYETAVDLCGTLFARCVNYPRDGKGSSALAKDLIRASRLTGISMSAIAERWAETSDRCPTYHNLLVAGEGIRGPVPDELPKLDEKNRVPENEYQDLVAGIDLKAVERVHQKRSDEYRAVMREARKTSPERSRLAPWKLGASISAREEATIRERLGFELRLGDLEALGRR